MDSLREYGVDENCIRKIKHRWPDSLQDLWLTPLIEYIHFFDHPMEHIVDSAFTSIQKKIGIEHLIACPGKPEDFEKLKVECDFLDASVV